MQTGGGAGGACAPRTGACSWHGGLPARLQLAAALRLARRRWVGDWLFGGEAGDAGHAMLPPEAFDGGLAVHFSDTMMAGGMGMGMGAGAGAVEGEERLVFAKELDKLIVPVCGMEGVTVGYTFCSGKQYSVLSGPMPTCGREPGTFVVCKFAYEAETREYIMVAPAVFPGITGILHHRHIDDSHRERNFLVVPLLAYTADDLPSIVLTAHATISVVDNTVEPSYQFEEPKRAAPGVDASAPPSRPDSAPANSAPWELDFPEAPVDGSGIADFMRDLAEDNVRDVLAAGGDAMDTFDGLPPLDYPPRPAQSVDFDWDTPALAPTRVASVSAVSSAVVTAPPSDGGSSWSFASDGSTADGIGVPRKPGAAPTSAGAFDMDALSASLAGIERTLKGSYRCERARNDVLDPVTGELLCRQTGRRFGSVNAMKPSVMDNFRRLAAQNYYALFLSPKVDASLVVRSQSDAATALTLPSSDDVLTRVQSTLAALSRPLIGSPTTASPQPPSSPPECASASGSAPSVNPVATPLPPRSVAAATLAPRPEPNASKGVAIKPANTTSYTKDDADAAAITSDVVDKAELKKIRNRLSAARSNQRRKRALEVQRHELVLLHERVDDLRKTRQRVMEENEYLKSRFIARTAESLT